jgi:hypothetical protein
MAAATSSAASTRIHAFFGMVPVVDDAMSAQRQAWSAFKRALA